MPVVKFVSYLCLSLLLACPALVRAQHLTTDSPGRVEQGVNQLLERYDGTLFEKSNRPNSYSLPFTISRTTPHRGTLFNTRTLFNSGWTARDFTTVFSTDSLELWVETAEISNNTVDALSIDTIATYLSEATPPSSIDPAKGILANTITYFGELPNVDGDGIVDILWYDIRDDYPSTPQFLDHLVIPEDLNTASPDSVGNRRDIVYVDTRPLFTEFNDGTGNVARATATALQKLIHLGFDSDEDEFLVSGLSHNAPLLNGFPGPGYEYLLFPGEHNIGLTDFVGLPGDIQRSALLVNYLTEQTGIQMLKDLTVDTTNGVSSVVNALALSGDARSVDEMILDFHTANLINDLEVDARWSYSRETWTDLRAAATFRVDGSVTTEANTLPIDLAPGGVQYFQIDNVRNPVGRAVALTTGEQSSLFGRLVGYSIDGSVLTEDTDSTGEAELVGSFDKVVLIVTSSVENTIGVPMAIETSWDGTAYPTVNIVYDDGRTAATGPNFFELGSEFKQATYFPNPDGYLPYHLSITPFFRNQFVNSGTGEPNGDPSDPRDFNLCITDVSIEGRPTGDCIVDESFNDPRPFGMVSSSDPSLGFLTVDLTQYSEELSEIGDLFVVVSEAGDDDNVLVMGLSTYTTENVSFLYGPLGATDWYPLWNVIAGGDTLNNRVIPMRMQFQDRPVIIGTEDVAGMSDQISLEQNFPNPFTDRTTIAIHLASTADVSLVVYDLLGREVERLVDDTLPGGNYHFLFTGDGLASGLYLYRLRTGSTFTSRTMILAK